MLTYSSQGLNGGTNDPCENVRGLVRRQSGQDDFQLSGVGADDFDVFLTVLRAQYVASRFPYRHRLTATIV